MDLDIVPAGSVDLEMLRDLGELCGRLRVADLPVVPSSAQLPGIKDSSLTVAIAAAGLAVSSLSTLVSALTYWSSQRPRYKLSVERGDVKLEIDQLDAKGVQNLVQQLGSVDEKQSMRVRVKVEQ